MREQGQQTGIFQHPMESRRNRGLPSEPKPEAARERGRNTSRRRRQRESLETSKKRQRENKGSGVNIEARGARDAKRRTERRGKRETNVANRASLAEKNATPDTPRLANHASENGRMRTRTGRKAKNEWRDKGKGRAKEGESREEGLAQMRARPTRSPSCRGRAIRDARFTVGKRPSLDA